MTAPSAANAAPPVEAAHPHSLASRVAGAVLLLFMAAGLVSTVVAVATDRLELAPRPITASAFLDGASMRDMASALAEAPMARGAATLERQASWLAIGDLGPQVRQGCTGWLFLAEELAPQRDALEHQRARARAVVAIHDQLRQRGIQLVVAMVPDKSRIDSRQMCGLHRPPVFENRLRTWIGGLKAAGVPVIDTTPALQSLQERGQEPFLRTDTHWNEAGAAAAAQAVAGAIRALGIAPQPQQDYDIVTEPAAVRPGDLVRLAGVDGLPPRWQPAPETTVSSRFTARAAAPGANASPEAVPGSAPAPAAASAEDELFGDQNLPTVALLGTSFSRNSHFAEFLAAAVRSPVASFARDGGNFWGSAGAYFRSDAFRQTPPRLIVWEIPERTLQLPSGDERWTLP
ncbi:cell division protein FtsQ [Xylophilus sp. Kf1]|nr:cell division protein FtsQ [Xylophilus sp. Kf1]